MVGKSVSIESNSETADNSYGFPFLIFRDFISRSNSDISCGESCRPIEATDKDILIGSGKVSDRNGSGICV
jgi:hypothetical protein